MARPVVKRARSGDVFTTMYHFWTSGDAEPEITLKYDGTILVAKGRVVVIVNGVRNEFTAPHIVFRKANAPYALEAITDNTVVYSVVAVRDGEGNMLDADMIPTGTPELEALLNAMRA